VGISKIMDISELQPEKQDFPMISTDDGRVISGSPESANAKSPISRRRDPDANEKERRDSHRRKADFEKMATEEGMTIAFRPVDPHASSSISERRDPSSKAMSDRELQQEKQDLAKCSILKGIQFRCEMP
jgi:hypothetical protein